MYLLDNKSWANDTLGKIIVEAKNEPYERIEIEWRKEENDEEIE